MFRSRFGVRTVAPLIALLALTLALQSTPASAGITWCRADPGLSLNGAEVQIFVAIPDQYQDLVSGPIRVTVKTPRGVDRAVLWTDSGFNGYGEDVQFDTIRGSIAPDGSFPVVIQVSVPVEGAFAVPMQVDIISGNESALVVEAKASGVSVKTRVWGAH